MRSLLASLFGLAASAGLAVETALPRSGFALGHVDLVALAASMPPIESTESVEPAPERLPTCRELHARIEAFLANRVRASVASAQGRLASAERRVAVSPGANSSDSLSALLVVLAGSISYATSPGIRDAKACLAVIEAYDAKVRALRDDVPETDSTAPPGLLERYERVTAELDERTLCHRAR